MAFMSRESRKFDEQLKLKALLDRMDQREQEREEREREKERENSEKQTVKERIQPGQSVHSNPFPRRSETREEEKVGAKEESNRRPALQQEDVATRGDWRGSQRVVGQQLNPGRSSVSPPEQTAAKNQPQSRGNDWVHASAVVDSIEDAITTLPGNNPAGCVLVFYWLSVLWPCLCFLLVVLWLRRCFLLVVCSVAVSLFSIVCCVAVSFSIGCQFCGCVVVFCWLCSVAVSLFSSGCVLCGCGCFLLVVLWLCPCFLLVVLWLCPCFLLFVCCVAVSLFSIGCSVAVS